MSAKLKTKMEAANYRQWRKLIAIHVLPWLRRDWHWREIPKIQNIYTRNSRIRRHSRQERSNNKKYNRRQLPSADKRLEYSKQKS